MEFGQTLLKSTWAYTYAFTAKTPNIQLHVSIFLFLLYVTFCTQQELYTLRFRQNLYYFFKSSPKPLRALILRCVKITTIKMANKPKSLLITISIITLVREQLTIMQQSFIDALAQQWAALEAQYQQLIEALCKELRNIKAFMLQTLIATPINKIKIMVPKPNPLKANTKLIMVA